MRGYTLKIHKTNHFKQFLRGVFVELNLKSKKYNRHEENIAFHLRNVGAALDKLWAGYENIILLGDFNVEVNLKNISDFVRTYNLKSLVKQ